MDCEELEGDDIRKTMQSYADATELMATSLNDRLERMNEREEHLHTDEMADEEDDDDDDDDDDDESKRGEQDVVSESFRKEENALLELTAHFAKPDCAHAYR